MILQRIRTQTRAGQSLLHSWRGWRLIVRLAPGLVAGLLLYSALRGARLDVIWRLTSQLAAWQLLAIFALDSAILLVFGIRWWSLARVQTQGIGLMDAVLVRLSAFGISYFTPGPQFGGEPLQVLYLNRQHRTSLVHATAVVALDKLIELLANYFLLLAGGAALVRSGLIPLAAPTAFVALVVVMALGAWPLIHLLLLRANLQPLYSGISRVWHGPGWRSRALRQIRIAERLMGRFCRRRPRLLLSVLALSLCAAGLGVAEYALITFSFAPVLSVGQTLSAWTAAWLAFLVPVPGGLGALEASQVVALGHFGVAAEAAIGVTLLMRARDIVMGGTGMLLAALRWPSWTSRSRQTGVF